MTEAGKNSSEKKPCPPQAQPLPPDFPPALHTPVLLEETVRFLAPVDGGTYIDGTLGLGGHAERILQACGPSGTVIGFEWDADALQLARKRLAPYGDRFLAQHRSYTEIPAALRDTGIGPVNGLLLDLGVSSLQFDADGRGFSLQADGPLDMRMDRRKNRSAEEIVNESSQEELADIFYYYGEERQARRIAANIVAAREKERLTTTSQLARIVAGAVPRRFQPRKIHAATKVFQALRIAVNGELDNLQAALEAVPTILKPGGRVCIISFHSLEDRLVKWNFKETAALEILTKKPVVPGEKEIAANPRARSAKLRAAYRKQ